TRKRLRSRLSRSAVLAPIEPVAPSNVTVRSRTAGAERSKATRETSDFIYSPYQQTTPRRLEAATRQADQRRHGAGCDETVEPVHQPAMAGNEMARILGAESALEKRFE